MFFQATICRDERSSVGADFQIELENIFQSPKAVSRNHHFFFSLSVLCLSPVAWGDIFGVGGFYYS